VARFVEAVSDHLEERREERVRQAEQAAYAARYAREIVVVAQTATVTVQRRRDQWQEAQQQLDAEWAAYRAADERVAHTVRAAAFDSHSVAYLPVHFAARERYLHTAATEAHRRGEISGAQLVDAMAHRNGWNPCLHPADQDVVLARAARTTLYRNYQRAVAAERIAWHEAEVAVIAARTLRAEADIAAHLSTPRVAVPRQRLGVAFAPAMASSPGL
jgi:hypothetical protein